MFNDGASRPRGAQQGTGLVQPIDLCVRHQLADSSLVRVLAPRCGPFPGFFLYVPSRAQMPARIRALTSFPIEQRERLARESREAIHAGGRGRKAPPAEAAAAQPR
ncbi:hypothetical protein [Pseudorhodoferax sp.]|uniref:hypothetical protein n=1 Tax=Pseudorhodoferax sp. TaxID=1993553 RepID=UPI0039E5DAEF